MTKMKVSDTSGLVSNSTTESFHSQSLVWYDANINSMLEITSTKLN